MSEAVIILGIIYIVIGAILNLSVVGNDLKTGKASLTGFLGAIAGTSGLFEILFLAFWPVWVWLYWRSEKKEPIQPPETTRGK